MPVRGVSTHFTLRAARRAAATALLLLVAGPAMAQADAEWRDFGDWSVHRDLRSNRSMLVNALPSTRTARMGCAATFAGDPTELRIPDADIGGARNAMAAPGFACIVFTCGRGRRLMSAVVNAPRAAGSVVVPAGRFSLYLRVGAAAERAIFTNVPARGPAETPDGPFVLDAFSFDVSGDTDRPIGLRLSIWTSAAFLASLAGHDRLGLRIPAGRDDRGHPDADVPHAGRAANFGLAETAAALTHFGRFCSPAD